MTEPPPEGTTEFRVSSRRRADRAAPSSYRPTKDPRAEALRFVGEFARSHGGASLVAEIHLDADRFRMRMSAGEDLCFSGPDDLGVYLRSFAAGRPERRPGDRRKDVGGRDRSKQ